ncbi:MAG: CzcE family metal-binding protein [Pseudomonadota bacterium]|nr:CzcE family metal-binding protein [Pseudomonadota bacterium]
MRYVRVVMCGAAAILGGCTSLQLTPALNLLGDPAPLAAVTRTVELSAATNYVNVTGGQIVKFVDRDNAFAWNFDGSEDISAFDLARVAPVGMLSHSVIAYIAPNPLYLGGHRRGLGDKR